MVSYAEELSVHLNGVGNIELAGQVMEQDVEINGFGAYRAAKLESQTVVVDIREAGSAAFHIFDPAHS